MIEREASDDDIRHVCRHLRPEDHFEQLCVRWTDDVERLADELVAWRPYAINQTALCCDDGEPAILVGAYMSSPKVARFHMCSTGRFAEVARPGHRWGRRRFIPLVLAPNVRVAEARILAGNDLARRWVAACGFVEEGIAVARGKNGEDFVHVAWINPRGAEL